MAKPRKLNCIKDVLKEQGRTQVWLAQKLGREYVTVTRWVNNTNQPSLQMLFDIAHALQVSVKDLINE
jgi:transcriptional regulator with XRE-family HTH domain